MRKKLLSIFVLGILIVTGFWIVRIFRKNPLPAKPTVQNEKHRFYVTVPIEHFTDGDLPCLNVEIEGQKFLTLLDLGFSGEISLLNSSLERITEKLFMKKTSRWGLRGIEYKKNLYQIPKLRIRNLTFSPPRLEEEDESLLQGAVIIGSNESDLRVGKLGWRLFNNMTLFLDMKHSTITICDSIETFKEKGYPLNAFTKVPFLDDHNLVEFNIKTPDGLLRCMLDSGATLNYLNTDNPDNVPLADMIRNEKNFTKFPTVQIGEKDFGPITFRPLPLKLPVHIEAMIGMEFLFEHLVFIDFVNRYIYIAPAEQEL